MNLQQAKALAIEEGNVKTIHDKNNQLLWGAVGYDVKYKGDTTQASYSGKNLWNPDVYYSNNDVYTPSVGTTIPNTLNPNVTSSFTDNQITVISTIKNGGGMYLSPALSPGTYHISVNITPSGGSGGRIRANILDSSHTVLRNDDYWSIGAGTTRQIDFNVTVASGEVYIAISLIATGDNGGTVTANNPQLELGSSATTYQKFVGGIPSPNPGYPQTVNVVTGTQTITLTDGVVSDDYTVNLGTTELCKIGDYQDYIYKSGDNWYIHKEINREDLDGSSDEQWVRQISGGDLTTAWFQHTFEYPSVSTNERLYILSNNFTNVGSINYQNTTEGMGTLQDSVRFRWQMATIQNLTNWRAWLGTHPTTVYYMMRTSIETQITDATLISQLDAIHQFLTRYGYNATVSGNLPIIIDRTNL